MATIGKNWGWKLGIVSFVAMGGAIASCENYAFAQIAPDNTLGAESSVVTPNAGNVDEISGGATRGANLFHSFEQFSVRTGGEAFFNNAASIQNVISRVTGGSVSNIDGLLRANGTANLFLLNPNGIIFGPNAQLNIGGSFVGTTANAIQFGEQGFFSASAPNAPPLLTVNPSAILFNQIAAQPVNSIESRGNLSVPDGRSLLLLGGNISPSTTSTGGILIGGGRLRAPSGRVEVGGLAGAGAVELNVIDNNLSFSFPDGVVRADVSLTNLAEIDVTSGGGGSIAINAQNINILEGSDICAGIGPAEACGEQASDFGSTGSQAGDITLNALGAITINGQVSEVANNVNLGANGEGGDINITTRSLSITNGGQLSASTFGQGNAGSVNISALDTVSLDDSDGDSGSFIFNNVLSDAVGNSGGINITTSSLSLTNGAQIQSRTLGQGDAGSLKIVGDTVSLDGTDNEGFPSGIFANVGDGAQGNSSGIDITTGSLSITGDAQLSASTYGQGNAGSVNILANDKILMGGSNGNGLILNNVGSSQAVGSSGGVNITTGALSVTNASQIRSQTLGSGNAGKITIVARDTVSFDGRDETDRIPSAAFTSVEPGAVGDGGNINITTGSLSITNRAQLLSNTKGTGNAGDITIEARDRVSLINSSIISEVTEETGVGEGGDINIKTGSLLLKDASALLADAENLGNAGNITIEARDAVILEGEGPSARSGSAADGFIVPSQITATVEPQAVGNGGDINITARLLSVTDDGFIRPSTFGQGDSGDLNITTENLSLANGALLSANTSGPGNAGNLTIATERLSLTNGATVTVATSGTGNAGNLSVVDADLVELVGTDSEGNPSGLLANVREGASGIGGNLTIETRQLNVRDGAQVAVDSEGTGAAGNLEVVADSVLLENQAFLSADTTAGQGNIDLRSRDLVLRKGSNITTDATGTATGGNITIDTGVLAALENSDIRANAQEGPGGRVIINAQGIFGTEFRAQPTSESDITATSDLGPQFSGIVEINNPDVDPEQGLVELPQEVVDASNQIVAACVPGENQFNVIGRGGLPPNPREPLSGEAVLTNWATLEGAARSLSGGSLRSELRV